MEVGFGVDPIQAGITGHSVCFIITAHTRTSAPTELLRECANPPDVRLGHPARRRIFFSPPGTRQLELVTRSVGNQNAYWSELKFLSR